MFFCLVNQFKRVVGNSRQELIVSEQCAGTRCGEKLGSSNDRKPNVASIVIKYKRSVKWQVVVSLIL